MIKKHRVNAKHQSKNETGSMRVILSSNKGLIWLAAVFVVIVTFTVYLPTLKNGFVNWDDDVYVYENPHIQSIDFGLVKWVREVVIWHPLTMVTLAIDFAIWGLNPAGYHLTNILIHTINTVLVFTLVIKIIDFQKVNIKHITRSIIPPLVTALLFGIHPVHVESVAWVSERKDVLCAFFFLLTLLAYIKYISMGQKKLFSLPYILSIIMFIAALLSKPMAVSIPFILLILDYYPLRRLFESKGNNAKAVFSEKLPFFLIAFVSSLITIWTYRAESALQTLEASPLAIRFFVAIRAYIFYLAKMIFPINLAPFYPQPNKMIFFSFEYVAAFILFSVITLLCVCYIKKPLFLAAWLYYVIMLIPVIGIIQVGDFVAADRYTYLPSIGPFILIGLCVGLILEKCKRYRSIILIILFIVLGTFVSKTIRQISVWHDSLTLWSQSIRLFPDAAIAYSGRGAALNAKGLYHEAILDFNKAIEFNPRYVEAYSNRGAAFHNIAKYQEAIKNYNIAIRLNPRDASIYYNRAITYYLIGNYQEAISNYSDAIRLDPLYAEAYNNRGLALDHVGRPIDAIEDYNRAIMLNPADMLAFYNRGNSFRQLGYYQKAKKDYERAIQLNPLYARAYFNIGTVYSEMGYQDQALIYYKKAAQLGLKEAKDYLENRGN